MGQALTDKPQKNGRRVLEQRFPRQAYIVIRNPVWAAASPKKLLAPCRPSRLFRKTRVRPRLLRPPNEHAFERAASHRGL